MATKKLAVEKTAAKPRYAVQWCMVNTNLPAKASSYDPQHCAVVAEATGRTPNECDNKLRDALLGIAANNLARHFYRRTTSAQGGGRSDAISGRGLVYELVTGHEWVHDLD
jgi:hypothetical protein